jgi:hypothetical protein
MLDRCECCGANLALVGRVHRCVTKVPEPVTKDVTKKRGRPPLGERAMTAAERQRRCREGSGGEMEPAAGVISAVTEAACA